MTFVDTPGHPLFYFVIILFVSHTKVSCDATSIYPSEYEVKEYKTSPDELGIEETGIKAVKNIWDPKSKFATHLPCLHKCNSGVTGDTHEKVLPKDI